MEIEVEAKKGKRKKTLLALAHLFAKQLNLARSRYKLVISPKRNLLKDHGCRGVTSMHDGIIYICLETAMPTKQMMYTLAHEMVHVKQLAKGILRYAMQGQKEIVYWCGKLFDTKGKHYVERPWEYEAYSMQEILVRRLCK
jgi:hypothetical protein